MKFARLLLLPAALLMACGCHQEAASKAKPPEVVEVTMPVTETVTDYQDFTGRLDAVKSVDIRARVSGYVTQVPFKEGDIVKEGDLLFQIDPRSYDADYNVAAANYKQAIADQELQEKNIARAKKVIGTGGDHAGGIRHDRRRPGRSAGGRRRGARQPRPCQALCRLHPRHFAGHRPD